MKHSVKILLAGLLILVCAGAAWAFTDTTDLNSEELAAVEALSALGVIEGDPDGSFRPNEAVNRAELAKMLCVYAAETEFMAEAASFSDVAPGSWYYGWVNRAVERGWVNGYPDGSYRPQESVSQQEAAAVLLRLNGVNTANFDWPSDYIDTARELEMFTGFTFAGESSASRLIACQMIYNMLPQEAEQGDETEPQEEEAAQPQEEQGDGEDAATADALADGLYLGVVSGGAAGEFTLWQVDAPLPVSAGRRGLPAANTLISYTVKDGVVDGWSVLLDAASDSIVNTKALTRTAVKDGPYYWAATRTGKTVDDPVDLSSAKPLVRYCSYRNIAVGPNSLENRNYWLGDNCQVYEVREGKINPGDRDGIKTGQEVTLLVNDEDEVLFLFCWK